MHHKTIWATYAWSGITCQIDIDECAEGTHNCGSFHTCNDTDGDFSCECNANFESTPGSTPSGVQLSSWFRKHFVNLHGVRLPNNKSFTKFSMHTRRMSTDQFIHSIGLFHKHFAYILTCQIAKHVLVGTFSNNPLSLTCDDFDECAVGIAATCGVFNDNGTQVPMGTCVESSMTEL